MTSSALEKLHYLYKPYALGVVTLGYVVGELGHYLIGVTSKATAEDLHYGDISCQLNATDFLITELPFDCEKANNSDSCLALEYNGTKYCEWNYNGLGLDYQLLAGPSFIAVFTILGVVLGFVADKCNRVKVLAVCTIIFSIATLLMGSVKEYWHLVVLRMILAAGESGLNPLATGLLSDWFPSHQHGLVLSIFNWGIYGGYGTAFPIGRYVPKLNTWDLGWRLCYYGTGIVGIIIAALTAFTLKEPERKALGADAQKQGKDEKSMSIWKVMIQPNIILLVIAAGIRHCGGMTFAYDCDLYFRTYFPEYDLGWWLFAVTIVIGSIGVVVGGLASDKFVAKMGVRSRVAILALSQLIATPFAFGSVYFGPLWALITLGISYFFAEMWFGILFAVVVDIVPLKVRSTTVGIFLFVMNNMGGNLPILVEPTSKVIGFRESLFIYYAGFYGISSILFFLTMFFMDGKPKSETQRHAESGHVNSSFSNDDGRVVGLELPRIGMKQQSPYIENARL